jgi:hypothetical protein
MSAEWTSLSYRRSRQVGVVVILLAASPTILLLNFLAGAWMSALAAVMLAVALGLTLLTSRFDEIGSRDPITGLPDREAALARLDGILGETVSGSRQALVVVVSLAAPDEPLDEGEWRQLTLLGAVRMAQRLRRGDQIVRISDSSLAAILSPSLGITAQAAEGIIGRIACGFAEPLRIGARPVSPVISVGACLQHDAPAADAQSWLEAAECAAEMATTTDEPRLFPSGTTSIGEAFAAAREAESAPLARWARAEATVKLDDAAADEVRSQASRRRA